MWLRTQMQFSGYLWLKLSAGLQSNFGWGTVTSRHNRCYWLLAVIRRSTSKLTHVDLYTGLPHDTTAGFPRTSNQRDWKNVHEESRYLFITEYQQRHPVTSSLDYLQMWVNNTSQGNGITNVHEYWKQGSLWTTIRVPDQCKFFWHICWARPYPEQTQSTVWII